MRLQGRVADEQLLHHSRYGFGFLVEIAHPHPLGGFVHGGWGGVRFEEVPLQDAKRRTRSGARTRLKASLQGPQKLPFRRDARRFGIAVELFDQGVLPAGSPRRVLDAMHVERLGDLFGIDSQQASDDLQIARQAPFEQAAQSLEVDHLASRAIIHSSDLYVGQRPVGVGGGDHIHEFAAQSPGGLGWGDAKALLPKRFVDSSQGLLEFRLIVCQSGNEVSFPRPIDQIVPRAHGNS